MLGKNAAPFPGLPTRALLQAPLAPGPELMEPRAPSSPRLAGPSAPLRAVRAGQAGAKGQSPRQPFPPCPAALSSWHRTGAERPSCCARRCRTCGAHRSPCERRPSGFLVSHKPGSLPAPPQLGPSPACCPGSAIRAGALEPRLPSAPLPPSRSRVLGRQDAARAGPEPCRGRRCCGRRAGSAAAGQLCGWGRDRLCVGRDGRAVPERAAARVAAHVQG